MTRDKKLLVPVSEDSFEVPTELLRKRTRREVLIFGASALAALTAGTVLLPNETLQRLGVHRKLNVPGKIGCSIARSISMMMLLKRCTLQIVLYLPMLSLR